MTYPRYLRGGIPVLLVGLLVGALSGCDRDTSEARNAAAPAASPAATTATTASTAATAIAWFDGPVEEAFAQAQAQGKPVLLYWGAVWCPPCNEIKSTVFTRADFIAQTQTLIPVYLDGDTAGAQKWGAHFGAMGYPTLIVFAPDGTELTRFSSGLEPARYADILAGAQRGGRPVGDLLAQVRRDPAALTAEDWTVLAQYSWVAGQGPLIDEPSMLAVLQELAASCPQGLAATCLRLDLLALIAAMEAQDLPADRHARGLATLEAVLNNPTALRLNLVDLAYAGPDLVAALTALDSEKRSKLETRLLQAMDTLFADVALGVKQRFLTVRPAIFLWQQAQLEAEEAPAELRQKVRERVAWLDEAARTPAERQSVLFIAGGLLQRVGLVDEARALYEAEIRRAVAPHYYMSYLAALERDQGYVEAALSWARQAWEGATGPATRAQWGVQYVQTLLQLQPESAYVIDAVVRQILRELVAEPQAYFQRTRVRLERLGTQLQSWARTQDQPALWSGWQAAIQPLCASAPAEPVANPLCAGAAGASGPASA
ncbi:MAG: thioredoxin family protein [Oceanococcaceae bacterium]